MDIVRTLSLPRRVTPGLLAAALISFIPPSANTSRPLPCQGTGDGVARGGGLAADELPLQGKVHYVSPGIDIQAIIDAAPPGDTIYFEPGTYILTQAITLKSGQLYHGAPATILKGNSPVMVSKATDSHDIGIDGFTFEDGTSYIVLKGTDAANSHADRIKIVNNVFRNMKTNNHPDKVDQTAVALAFVKNSLIEHNVFSDLHRSSAIGISNANNTKITRNVFRNLYEAVSMQFDPIDGMGNNITVSYNVCTGIDRMCIELQTTGGSAKVGEVWTRNILVEGNWADDWSRTKDPNKIAYSIPLDSGADTVVRNNYARFGGSGIGGFGIELAGIGAQAYGNYLDGWKTSIILYESREIVRNNNLINCHLVSGNRYRTVHSIGCIDVFTKHSLSKDNIIESNISDSSMPVPPRPVQ